MHVSVREAEQAPAKEAAPERESAPEREAAPAPAREAAPVLEVEPAREAAPEPEACMVLFLMYSSAREPELLLVWLVPAGALFWLVRPDDRRVPAGAEEKRCIS